MISKKEVYRGRTDTKEGRKERRTHIKKSKKGKKCIKDERKKGIYIFIDIYIYI
jgi:hypothetical protein